MTFLNPRTGECVVSTPQIVALARAASGHQADDLFRPHIAAARRAKLEALAALSAACGGVGDRLAAIDVVRLMAHYCSRECVGAGECERARSVQFSAELAEFRAVGGTACASCYLLSGRRDCSAACVSVRSAERRARADARGWFDLGNGWTDLPHYPS